MHNKAKKNVVVVVVAVVGALWPIKDPPRLGSCYSLHSTVFSLLFSSSLAFPIKTDRTDIERDPEESKVSVPKGEGVYPAPVSCISTSTFTAVHVNGSSFP